MSHQTLYRKYRSQTFSDLIGQDHVVRTLQNGISSGRIAHSYLFTGPRGTGKTSTARLLAKALCCEHGPTGEPDNTCEICTSITLGNCVDVIEMDAASESGVEEVREQIVEVVEYRPMICRYKVFIIDEVHDLSGKAFDALLKTIEEPPDHIIFILATTEYNKVPPTIRSRCQKFEFHRASMQDLVKRLEYVAQAEGIQIEPSAVSAIARMADGGYRDALTLLEQAIVTSQDGKITLDQVYDQLGLVSEEVVDGLLLSIKESDVVSIMDQLAEVARLGRDPRAILESMMYRLADLTRASYQVNIGAPDAPAEAALHETATRIGRDRLLKLRAEIAEAHKTIRDISLPRLWLEAELVRLATQRQQSAAAVVAEPAPRPRETSKPQVERAPKPAPVEEPAPVQAEAPVAPVAVAAPAKGGVWDKCTAELSTLSRTLGMKLVGSRLTTDEPGRIVVELSKEAFYEWITEKPKVMAEIVRVVSQIRESETKVEFAWRRDDSFANGEPDTVELPAEGQRLEQLAREVFGA